MDPNSENFCAYFTPLPTLGGTNASFGAINNLGAESGYAENKHRYPIAVPVWQSAAPALRSSTLNRSYGTKARTPPTSSPPRRYSRNGPGTQ